MSQKQAQRANKRLFLQLLLLEEVAAWGLVEGIVDVEVEQVQISNMKIKIKFGVVN